MYIISGSNLLATIANGISSLNPLQQMKPYRHEIMLTCAIILIVFFCFCVVWRRTVRRQQHHQQKLAFLTITSLAEKQKGGDVGSKYKEEKADPRKGVRKHYQSC